MRRDESSYADEAYDAQEQRIYDRGSTVSPAFYHRRVRIYHGKGFTYRSIIPWMYGFKFGEFTWTRKLALYKAKQLRKKKKK
jgi:ribosomal protein S19